MFKWGSNFGVKFNHIQNQLGYATAKFLFLLLLLGRKNVAEQLSNFIEIISGGHALSIMNLTCNRHGIRDGSEVSSEANSSRHMTYKYTHYNKNITSTLNRLLLLILVYQQEFSVQIIFYHFGPC